MQAAGSQSSFILFLIIFLSFRGNLDRKLFIELEGFSHESSQDEKMGFLSKSSEFVPL